MAEESTRIVHGPTFKNLLDNVTKLEKQTQKKDLSSDCLLYTSDAADD